MDLERATLQILVEREQLREVWDRGLRGEFFNDVLNRACFEFILSYWLDSSMESAPTKAVIGYEFPGITFEEEPVEETASWLVEKLKERYARNQVQELVRTAAKQSGSGEVHESIKTLYQGSWDVLQSVIPRVGRSDLSQNVMERRQRYLERSQRPDGLRGAPTGFIEIDEHTSGTMPGEVAVVGGYAKTGKSWFLANSAVEARRAGFTPYLATMELSVPEFEDRVDAKISGISYQKIQRGQMDFDDIRILSEAQDEFAQLGSFFMERPPTGERTVQYLVNRARDLGADYLLIDQLSFIEAKRDYRDNKRLEVGEKISDLKIEASQDSSRAIPVLIASQLNRDAKTQRKGRGGMENLAESGFIEQAVDIAYGLSQSTEMRANRSMVCDIMGARRTAPGSWLLQWDLTERTAFSVRERYDD